MKKNKKITTSFCLLLSLFFLNCRKYENHDLKFYPVFSTKFNLENVDSIVLIDYYKNKIMDSSKIKLRFKFELDSTYPKAYTEAKWKFGLWDSCVQHHNYKLIINIKKNKHQYYIEDIDYDTIRNGHTILHTTKSYILNGKKYGFEDATYYLDIDESFAK